MGDGIIGSLGDGIIGFDRWVTVAFPSGSGWRVLMVVDEDGE